ncbi:MAG: glycosyltransferase [Anaerolineales bacterium]|nr:glycosyltransferase [Anaerolineales bacterium]
MDRDNIGGDPTLRYSVIVPLHNGSSTIEGCLEGLACQQAEPGIFEVIVVDDGSTDESVSVVQAWVSRHPELSVRLLCQAHAGMAAARNLGANDASGPILLFTDADCVPSPTWVTTLGAAFADATVVGARGVVTTDQAGLAPRFVQAEYEDRYDHAGQKPEINFIDNFSAGYRRDIFLLNAGFDTNFAACEDQELSFRLAEKGYRMVFVPQATVTHQHDANIRTYAWRKAVTGFWKAPLTRLHPERMVEDTHTPQVLKLQIVTVSLFVFSGNPGAPGAGLAGVRMALDGGSGAAWRLPGVGAPLSGEVDTAIVDACAHRPLDVGRALARPGLWLSGRHDSLRGFSARRTRAHHSGLEAGDQAQHGYCGRPRWAGHRHPTRCGRRRRHQTRFARPDLLLAGADRRKRPAVPDR